MAANAVSPTNGGGCPLVATRALPRATTKASPDQQNYRYAVGSHPFGCIPSGHYAEEVRPAGYAVSGTVTVLGSRFSIHPSSFDA